MTSFSTIQISDADHFSHNPQIFDSILSPNIANVNNSDHQSIANKLTAQSDKKQIQIDTRPRRERRPEIIKLEKKKRKLVRQIRVTNLQVDFDNDTVTAFGNFHTIETFKQAIGLNTVINHNLTLTKGINSIYNATQIVDYMIDSCCLGLFRF